MFLVLKKKLKPRENQFIPSSFVDIEKKFDIFLKLLITNYICKKEDNSCVTSGKGFSHTETKKT